MKNKEMYTEVVVELSRNPLNFGELPDCTHTATEHNPLCGDEVTIHFTVDKGDITDVRFSGEGCALSRVSASLMTEHIKGKRVSEVLALQEKDITELLEIPIRPARLKCVLLPLVSAKKALLDGS